MPSPLAATFYMYSTASKEYRYFPRSTTGYAAHIGVERSFGLDARSSTVWSTSSEICVNGSCPY